MTLDRDMMTFVIIALLFVGVAGYPITLAFDNWRASINAKKTYGKED